MFVEMRFIMMMMYNGPNIMGYGQQTGICINSIRWVGVPL